MVKKKYQIIEEWLITRIENHEIPVGDKLPSENELCKKFTVSRNVVRQALSNLKISGYVKSVDKIGYFCEGPQHRNKLTKNIGFIAYYSNSYIFPRLINGCDHVLFKKGFHLILGNSEYNLKRERSLLFDFLEKNVDGLIIEPIFAPENPSNLDLLDEYKSRGIPLVLLDNTFPECEFNYVCLDDFTAGKMMAEYVYKKGHRNIGIIYKDDYYPKIQRKNGALSYINEYIPDNDIGNIISINENSFSSNFKEQITHMLNKKVRPTVLICTSDEDALTIISAVKEAGFSVPGDISVTGFDNLDLEGVSDINLTTFEHPGEHMGRIAADIILNKIENPNLEIKTQTVIKPKFIERKSVLELL